MANEDISVTLTGTPEEKRYALDTIRQDMGGPTANQMARFTPTSPQIDSALDSRQKEIGALDERLGPLRQNVDQAVTGVQQAGAQAMPPVPDLQPTPKYIPKELSQETMVNFGSLAMAFAALAGMRTRQPLTAAMNAAGAAMNGFSQGNIAQVKQDLEVFKAQSDSALASNRQMLAQYESILSNRRLTFAEKMAEYRMAADRYGDEISKTFLKVGSIDKLMQFYQHQLDAQNKFEQHVADMRQRYELAYAGMENRLQMVQDKNALTTPAELSPDALDNAAAFFILNGRMPIGLSRIGPATLGMIQNRAAEMTQAAGFTPQDFAASGPIVKQKLGALLQLEKNRNAIQAYEAMLNKNIEVLKVLSEKITRSDSPAANRPILWMQQNMQGDPDVAEYLFQVNIVATEIARTLNNPNLVGQLTDTARQEVEQVVSGRLTPAQMSNVLARAQADAHNRAASFDTQVKKLISEIRDPLNKGEMGEKPAQQPAPQWGADKEQRYQELLRKRSATQ